MTARFGPCLVVVLLIAGCAAERSGVHDDTPEVDPLQSLGIDLAEEDPFVQRILADGVVTPSELEAAILAAVACMDEQGLVVEAEITDIDKGAFRLRYAAGPTVDDLEVVLGIERQCQERFLASVSYVHSRQIAPSQEEFLRQYEELARCLEERGIDVTDPTPEGVGDAFFSHPDDYAHCSERVGL